MPVALGACPFRTHLLRWHRQVLPENDASSLLSFTVNFLSFLDTTCCVLCFHTKSVVLPIFLQQAVLWRLAQAPLPARGQQEWPWARLCWRCLRHKKGAIPVERNWTGLRQAVPLKYSDVLSTCGESGKRFHFCLAFFSALVTGCTYCYHD